MAVKKKRFSSFSLTPSFFAQYCDDHDVDMKEVGYLVDSIVNIQVDDDSVYISFSGKLFKNLTHFQKIADSLFHGSRYYYFATVEDFYGIQISHLEFVRLMFNYLYITSY